MMFRGGTEKKLLSIKISKNELVQFVACALVLLSCYPIAIAENLWKLTLIFSIFFVLATMLGERIKPSKMAIALIAFLIINILSTVLNGNLGQQNIIIYARCLIYILWCDSYCRRHTKIFSYSHVIIVGMIFLLQLFFQIFDRTRFGVSSSSGNVINLLDSDNFLGYYVVPFIMLVVLASLQQKARLNFISIILVVLCTYSIVISGAGACTVGTCLYVGLLVIFCLILKDFAKIPIWILYIVYGVIFAGIMIYSAQTLASDFLENVLGKDTTFTGRTDIWVLVPAYILKKPWLGYGVTDSGKALVISIWGNKHSAHNYFFDMILEGGFIELAAYFNVLRITAKALRESVDNMIANVVTLGIFCMFIMYISEGSVLLPAQYLIFILAYYSNLFARKNITSSQIVLDVRRMKIKKVRIRR